MDAEPEDPRPICWPLHVMDFEASGLVPGSYPIEVGVCRWISPDCPIEGWSTLIRPTAGWDGEDVWVAEAETVHGINRQELQQGMEPAEVVAALNAIIGDHAAFCDGGSWDMGWSRRLVLAAGINNRWRFGDFSMLKMRVGEFGRSRLDRWLGRTPARHRARDDAERLMKALALGLGVPHGSSIDIEPAPSPARKDHDHRSQG